MTMVDNLFNRRTFLIRLGAGVAGSIGGYFLIRNWPQNTAVDMSAIQTTSLHPQIKKDIVFGQYQDMTTISNGKGKENVLCAFNLPGEIIISKLDGEHTIEQISDALISGLDLKTKLSLDAPIATFVAQLGMLGFLTEPFHATIYYENTITYG